MRTYSDRQYDGLVVSSKERGYKECELDSNKQENLEIPYKAWDHDYCRVPTGSLECSSRLGVQELERLQRVDAKTRCISEGMPVLGKSTSRFVCLTNLPSDSDILVLEARPAESRKGCLSNHLEKEINVCLSSICTNRQGFEESSKGEGNNDTDNSNVAFTGLVSLASANDHPQSNSSTPKEGPSKSPLRGCASFDRTRNP